MRLFDPILQFLNTGGLVLWIILGISILLWSLITERLIFLKMSYPALQNNWLEQWKNQSNKHSQQALFIRQGIISEAKISLRQSLPVIKMLIALCPLFGLLGTVTGMIHVFDVMAVTGTGNARAMAAGVSHGTVPTMAGMVIAISGLYFSKSIEQRVDQETHQLTDLLHS